MKFRKSIFIVMSFSILVSITGCSGNNHSSTSAIQPSPDKTISSENKTDKDNTSDVKNKTNNDITQNGLLLGLSNISKDNGKGSEDPKGIPESYKTIWISPKGSSYSYLQKDGFIIAPGKDGFYKLERAYGKFEGKNSSSDIEVNKLITYKVGSNSDTKVKIDEETTKGIMYSSEVFNADFIGNNYYIVSYLQIYTSGAGGYQYMPSKKVSTLGNNIKAWMEGTSDNNKSTSLKDIFSSEDKNKINSQIESLKKLYNKTVNKESPNDREYVAEDDLTFLRKDGKWRLFVPIKFSNWKDSHNFFIDYKEIDCPLPNSLTSYDELCMPYDEIKRIIPDTKDAVSSPDKSVLVVQTSDKLLVYLNPLKGIDKTTTEIPINKDDKIVLNQWSTGSYVEKWDEELTKILNKY